MQSTAQQTIPCDTAWISVVDRTGSEGVRRPFESIKCDAKIVFIRVDFPSPVCPVEVLIRDAKTGRQLEPTNTDDIELKASLQRLSLNLGCDAVKANMAFGYYGPRLA